MPDHTASSRSRERIDCAAFASRYGFSPQEALARTVRGMLALRPERWEAPGMDPDASRELREHDLARRADAVAFARGELPFDRLLPGMGSLAHDIVHDCDPDPDILRAAAAAALAAESGE